MAPKKRPSSENPLDMEEPRQQHHRRRRPRRERQQSQAVELEEDDDQQVEVEETENDSDGIPVEDLPEYFYVNLREICKDVQCPICLGIIKKTRTVMECMHRFCKECIDKAMRLGNNECPACRTHCASRRSLRDNPSFDKIIAEFFPNIEKFEEEEAAIAEEEQLRNKEIQESIAEIHQRQFEAVNKKRSRRRRNRRIADIQEYIEIEDVNELGGNIDSSSADERGPVVESRMYTRRRGARHSRPSTSGPNTNGHIENEREQSTERRSTSPTAEGTVLRAEGLTWGRGGARSRNRHGGASSSRGTGGRLSELVVHLNGSKESDEFVVNIVLIPLEKERTPSLQQPQLCCRSSFSVKHLSEHVARETSMKAEDVEILLVKEPVDLNDEPPLTDNTSTPIRDDLNSMSEAVGRSNLWLRLLDGQEILADLKKTIDLSCKNLIFAYRQKGN